jgi:hypothetical protein
MCNSTVKIIGIIYSKGREEDEMFWIVWLRIALLKSLGNSAKAPSLTHPRYPGGGEKKEDGIAPAGWKVWFEIRFALIGIRRDYSGGGN